MGNRIPKTATRLEVTFLTDSNIGKSGIKIIAEKNDNRWIGKQDEQSWHLLPAHLRNENYCLIKVLV